MGPPGRASAYRKAPKPSAHRGPSGKGSGMRIHIDVEMRYRFTRPNTVLLALETAEAAGQEIVSADLALGDADVHRIIGDSGIGQRIWARITGTEMNLTYRALVDVTRPNLSLDGFDAVPVHLLHGEVVPYLRASRYCHSDKFVTFVDRRFGHLSGGRKIGAIRDWIEAELTYVPGSSDADTNVLETFAGRQGVCRDYAHLMCSMVRAAQIPATMRAGIYAHLMCSMVRAAQIPARLVAAYSPDIVPPDFHALAEVWLDGQWHLVDATGMCCADSLAVIAVGRDAYDIAFMESQAPAEMLTQPVRV